VKNETVIGTMGNTHGVSNDSAPMTAARLTYAPKVLARVDAISVTTGDDGLRLVTTGDDRSRLVTTGAGAELTEEDGCVSSFLGPVVTCRDPSLPVVPVIAAVSSTSVGGKQSR
jgi:hypothetical protein